MGIFSSCHIFYKVKCIRASANQLNKCLLLFFFLEALNFFCVSVDIHLLTSVKKSFNDVRKPQHINLLVSKECPLTLSISMKLTR